MPALSGETQMKISELVDRLEQIRRDEGDIEVELPSGQLMRKVDVVTKQARANRALLARKDSIGE